jgi:hypothetical protein
MPANGATGWAGLGLWAKPEEAASEKFRRCMLRASGAGESTSFIGRLKVTSEDMSVADAEAVGRVEGTKDGTERGTTGSA